MTELDSSEFEESDSESELQNAFAAGRLKPGLYVESAPTKPQVCNVAGIKQKLDELKSKLDWIQRLDVTSRPAPVSVGVEFEDKEDVHDDFQREMKFYRQAQASVLEAIPRLQKTGLKTRRPEDYFAEMAKSDDHMNKIREKLLEKKLSMERSEKAKKMRELKKYGKKVQHEVLLKRQKEKKEMLDAVKKYRKGQKDRLDFLDDLDSSTQKQKRTPGPKKNEKTFLPNKKRQSKDARYGFGGQKKRMKHNTAKSSAEMTGFSRKINQPAGLKGKGKKGKKMQRPGKSKRQKFKNKNKRK